jgi:hypothetical protein
MNLHESNKYNMYTTTSGVLDDNKPKVESVPKLAAGAVKLGDGILKIKTVDKQYDDKSSPKGEVKKQARNAVVLSSLHVVHTLYAYAEDQNDEELKAKVTISETELHSMRDDEFMTKAENYYTLANGLIASLADYGLVPLDLTTFRTEIDAFTASKTNIGTGKAERVGTRSSLTECFTEVDTLLTGTTDKLMEGFRKKDPEFYNAYWSARVIRDIGGSHSKETTAATKTAAPPIAAPAATNA